MRALTLAIVLVTQVGCYTYAPAARELAPGSRVAYALTDRGRVAVADQVGPGVLRLEGTLVQDTGGGYVVAIARVRALDGGVSRWDGERVTVAHDHVANTYQRKFSKSRTALAAGIGVVGITAFILTRNLLGGGFGLFDGGNRGPDPNL